MKPREISALPENKLSHNMEISTLCAFYGGLLTPRQRMALQLHCDEDWSLAEVADHFRVSRQNIHDLIRRSVQKLHHYEAAVGGVAQAQRISRQLQKASRSLEAAESLADGTAAAFLQEAQAQIDKIMTDINGEE